MPRYRVQIRLDNALEFGREWTADSPSEAAERRIKALCDAGTYDEGTAIVRGEDNTDYVYDWTRETVTTKEVRLT